MGFFDDQIRQRNKSDEDLYNDSYEKINRQVLGVKSKAKSQGGKYTIQSALEEIFAFYGHKPVPIPTFVTDPLKQIEYSINNVGMMKRRIELKGKWYLDSFGPLLAFYRDTEEPVVLFPIGFTGYFYYDRNSGKKILVRGKNTKKLKDHAYCFYNPLPLRKLGIPALLSYMKSCISRYDVAIFTLVSVLTVLISLIAPNLTLILTTTVIKDKSINLLIGLGLVIVGATLMTAFLDSLKEVITARVKWKVTIPMEGAVMQRILSLPAPFFRNYSAGELTKRARGVAEICQLMITSVLSVGITSIISLIYVFQIFGYAPVLVVPSLIIIILTVLVGSITALVQIRISKKQMKLEAAEYGLTYGIISGIQKIRLAGAERRAFAKWASHYAEQASLTYNPPVFIKLNSVINTAITLLGAIVIYFCAIKSEVSASVFYSYSIVYGYVLEAFSLLAGVALSLADIRPVFELAEPILKAEPEAKENKEVIKRLTGSIEFNRVSFRYSKTEPDILRDFSLKIKPGDYVAIVGKTGCGKSTLVRLILGFERAQKGAVYIDGRDITKVDIRSLRRKIGTVLQEGKLFYGSIYENIAIAADNLTEEEAWEAAEIAGIADDIRAMPMGMHTVVSDGQGVISGGQKQRILIARAIAPKPRILIFDEATSALDNITQKKVSDALDNLKCTRIVVAHRLSTIRNCNRIMVLSDGKIAEEGTYEELMARKEKFYELVSNQQL
ncbi:ATP-binding cassette domain-containing protein [Butyrivibrio sp. MC2021]|uniref:ATP-binding cassette domain-containing protein n=1 Tax=Butyrivibrio sp. MC2021 TaxID=1408306 RepID=UPI00047AABEC|nr:ATP-binding cassette domain-containing protein [Butyrivibrio sp. MC2021]